MNDLVAILVAAKHYHWPGNQEYKVRYYHYKAQHLMNRVSNNSLTKRDQDWIKLSLNPDDVQFLGDMLQELPFELLPQSAQFLVNDLLMQIDATYKD